MVGDSSSVVGAVAPSDWDVYATHVFFGLLVVHHICIASTDVLFRAPLVMLARHGCRRQSVPAVLQTRAAAPLPRMVLLMTAPQGPCVDVLGHLDVRDRVSFATCSRASARAVSVMRVDSRVYTGSDRAWTTMCATVSHMGRGGPTVARDGACDAMLGRFPFATLDSRAPRIWQRLFASPASYVALTALIILCGGTPAVDVACVAVSCLGIGPLGQDPLVASRVMRSAVMVRATVLGGLAVMDTNFDASVVFPHALVHGFVVWQLVSTSMTRLRHVSVDTYCASRSLFLARLLLSYVASGYELVWASFAAEMFAATPHVLALLDARGVAVAKLRVGALHLCKYSLVFGVLAGSSHRWITWPLAVGALAWHCVVDDDDGSDRVRRPSPVGAALDGRRLRLLRVVLGPCARRGVQRLSLLRASVLGHEDVWTRAK